MAGGVIAAAVGGEESVRVEDGGVQGAAVPADVVVVQGGAAAVGADGAGAGAGAVGGLVGGEGGGGLAVAGVAVERGVGVGVGELHALLADDAVVPFGFERAPCGSTIWLAMDVALGVREW